MSVPPPFNPTFHVSTLKPIIDSPFSSNVHDCCVLLVICPKHRRFALCNFIHSGQHFRWFPWIHAWSQVCWKKMRNKALAAILGRKFRSQMILKSSCINLARVQRPHLARNFVTRVLFYVELNAAIVDICLMTPNVSEVFVEWCPIEAALDNETINNIWSPEVSKFMQMVHKNRIKHILTEESADEACALLESNLREDQELVQNLKLTHVERLYEDYIEHCFPAHEMSPCSFRSYLLKYGIETEKSRLDAYWNAFRSESKTSISFHALLKGLTAIDADTPHGLYRTKLIFRFYNIKQNNLLSVDELRHMLQDGSLKGRPPQEVEAKLDRIIADIKKRLVRKKARKNLALLAKGQLSLDTFLRAVAFKNIPGTSALCRSHLDLNSTITTAIMARHFERAFNKKQSFRGVITASHQTRKSCPSCVVRRETMPYTIANTIVTLNDSRQTMRIVTQQSRAASRSESSESSGESQTSSNEIQQRLLTVQFNPASLPNKYIRLIRDFCEKSLKSVSRRKRHKVMPLWSRLARQNKKEYAQVLAELEQICKQVHAIVKDEPHIVDLDSPVYVVGDIHGNLEDLISMEQALWPTIPYLNGVNYLFLGDYVDRGIWSFECVIYLCALKLLAPTKVTLLRGNHEDRELQERYSYKRELMHPLKFGKKDGEKMWQLTNKVFDCLPIGAIVDDTIFAVHGGIPRTDLDVPIRTAAQKFPKDLPDINDIDLFSDMLWSDPVNHKQFSEASEINYKQPEFLQNFELGFQLNYRRCSSYMFNEAAFLRFCAVNGTLTHMIRAHEVPREGYRLDFGHRCITVFSCSHYCTYDNECAVVLVLDNRLRVIKISTYMNSEATIFQ